jgi:hypothetical protein
MEVDDAVIRAAQDTVDAIDKKLEELGAAREAIVKMFGLGIRQKPKEVPPKPPIPPPKQTVNYELPDSRVCGVTKVERGQYESWTKKREQVLHRLGEGPCEVRVIRECFQIGSRTVPFVLNHPWFHRDGDTIMLSPEGEAELARERVSCNGE